MVGKLATLLLIVGGMFGQVKAQQGNTVFATIVTGRTTTGTFIVPSQYMIGQSGHQALATAVGNTQVSIQLQGSYDGTYWVNITPTTQASYTLPSIVAGQGLYPYVQVVATKITGTTGSYSVYYGAVVSGVTNAGIVVNPFTYNGNFGTIFSNRINMAEKGPRTMVTSGLSTAGSAAVTGGLSGATGQQQILDCISASLVASATVAVGGFDQLTITNAVGNQTLFTLGMPAGATLGTSVSRDICGLNLYTGMDLSPGTFQFNSGIANVREMITATYMSVGIQ